ncbi:type II secretion system protein [Lysinibacillus endophyticus]|uniref:type II secretion system protein n=1 Tax=Ureibacillus endophyticus TaxID=1978490 RepID=UPI00209E8FE7|nr:type II secretion system protein [Lysinibacillus endophyticus]MCP1144179.1 type II secretion system GspH family protein [Lysinibacillus endophyticus]
MQQKFVHEKIEINNRMKNLGGKGMFKEMKKRVNNQKGLTLIELLAVVVILAIVAAIAVPAIGNIINNSRDKAILAEASNVLSAAKLAHIDNKCTTASGTTTCNKAAITPYLDGVTLDDNDKAVLTDDIWEVTYKKLEKIVGDDYKSNITTNTVKEADLNTNLGN